MVENRAWRWQHEGGAHEVTLDLVGGDLLWWSELDPRGDLVDFTSPQAIESFLGGARPSYVRGFPADVETAVRTSLDEVATILAARPPADRLVASARGGDVPSLVEHLDAGVSPDAVDVRGRTALWGAIQNGHDEAARLLVERGAPVTPPPEAAPHDLLVHALAGRMFGAAAALLARGGLLVDESGIAQHWMIGYREHAPLELVRALAARAGRIDRPAAMYAARLAREREDNAMVGWLASEAVRGIARGAAAQARGGSISGDPIVEVIVTAGRVVFVFDYMLLFSVQSGSDSYEHHVFTGIATLCDGDLRDVHTIERVSRRLSEYDVEWAAKSYDRRAVVDEVHAAVLNGPK